MQEESQGSRDVVEVLPCVRPLRSGRSHAAGLHGVRGSDPSRFAALEGARTLSLVFPTPSHRLLRQTSSDLPTSPAAPDRAAYAAAARHKPVVPALPVNPARRRRTRPLLDQGILIPAVRSRSDRVSPTSTISVGPRQRAADPPKRCSLISM